MKHTLMKVLLAILACAGAMAATAAFMLPTACAGTLARSNALLPAMRDAWASMRVQAIREARETNSAGVANPQIGAADEGLATDNSTQIAAVNWTLLDGLVEGDITRRLNAGELGPAPAESLRERLRRFVESRNTYLRRAP